MKSVVRRLLVVAAVLALPLGLVAPTTAAAKPAKPAFRITVEHRSTPIFSYTPPSESEPPDTTAYPATVVHAKALRCDASRQDAYLYWTATATQNGRRLQSPFLGLGQGEATCGPNGRTTQDFLFYGADLHPGRIKVRVTLRDCCLDGVDTVVKRWVAVPR